MIDGTLETIDGRPALRFERRLPYPVQRVWRAVTEPAELERWFVAPVPWTPALGETFEGEGQRGEITALEEPLLLAWSWGDERYRFELRPDGDGCVLVFTHVFDARYGPAAQHAAGWEAYLERLAAQLAGGQLTEEAAHGAIGELHERYAIRFDQDPAPGRRMIAGMGFRDAARGRTAAARRAPLSRDDRARLARDQRARRARAVVRPRSARRDRARRALLLVGRGSATRCASSCGPTARAACCLHARLRRRDTARAPSGLGSLLRAHRRAAAGRPMSEADARALARGPRALRGVLRRRSRARSQGYAQTGD